SRPARHAHARGSRSAASQPPVDLVRSQLRLAHRLDDARAAVDGIAAGEYARVGGAPRLWIGGREQRRELRPDALADRLDDGVGTQGELAPGHRDRPAAPALVRLAELHRAQL